MARPAPLPRKQSQAKPSLAPSPTIASGSHSRSPPRQSRNSPPQQQRVTRPDRMNQPTQAEAYAYAHNKKKDKENHIPRVPTWQHPPAQSGSGTGVKTKPLFEWITRKLGAGRRATYSDGSAGPSSHRRAGPGGQAGPGGPGEAFKGASGRTNQNTVLKGSNRQLSPKQIFGSSMMTRDDSFVTRSGSHSLRSYSMSHANSIERRIANNPYPSIPVTTHYRESTIDTVSESFLSRSRTPSLRSEMSRPVRSLDRDDSSNKWNFSGGADEDASIRPFPPSHPNSPTPSQSILSRSASASLLSPMNQGLPRPSSYLSRTHRSLSISTRSSDLDLADGRQSRLDSTSTKPTVISFDSNQHVAHIAQAPQPVSAPIQHQNPIPPALPQLSHSTPASPLRHSQGDIGETQSARSSSRGLEIDVEQGTIQTLPQGGSLPCQVPPGPLAESTQHIQAPKHSHPHPRDNPHPSSPPEPNASTVTLASSTFAIFPTTNTASPLSPTGGIPVISGPTASRLREVTTSVPGLASPIRSTPLATSPSVTFASEKNLERPTSTYDYASSAHAPSVPSVYALSVYGGPSIGGMSIRTSGRWGTSTADGDASIRGLRRNGSWDSDKSVWSWREQKHGNSGHLGNPIISNRLSAYTINQDEDSNSSVQGVHGQRTRDSYYTAQSRVEKWGNDDETFGMEDGRYEMDRTGGNLIIA